MTNQHLVEIVKQTDGSWVENSFHYWDSRIYDEGYVAEIMKNIYNDYVEWKNNGVVYRVIRENDLKDYVK